MVHGGGGCGGGVATQTRRLPRRRMKGLGYIIIIQ